MLYLVADASGSSRDFGLTNVHVNRVMRQLREERLCVFRSSRVEILDPEGLGSRAQFDPAYLYIENDSELPSMKKRRL